MLNISIEILKWHQSNQKHYPWKKTKDPYKIWVSEIILQQTRTAQGLPYYLNFVENFPTIKHLAAASEDEVLAVWKGLGYYTRARNMHHTARYICKELHSNFPTNYDDLIKLRGIGPYSAAAISSFAFGEKRAVIDGNVIRVLSRYFGINKSINLALTIKTIKSHANQLLQNIDPGAFNQAIMDFGAHHCKPQQPKCKECPISKTCIAHQAGQELKYPIKAAKKKRKERYFHFIFCRQEDKCLITKRRDKDIWQGLYEFPNIETASSLSDPYESIQVYLSQNVGIVGPIITIFEKEFKQELSHQLIYAKFYKIDFTKLIWNNPKFELVETKNLSNFAVPKIVDRYLND